MITLKKQSKKLTTLQFTTPEVVSTPSSSSSSAVTKKVKYRTDPANYKRDFEYGGWTKTMQKCTASCTYVYCF